MRDCRINVFHSEEDRQCIAGLPDLQGSSASSDISRENRPRGRHCQRPVGGLYPRARPARLPVALPPDRPRRRPADNRGLLPCAYLSASILTSDPHSTPSSAPSTGPAVCGPGLTREVQSALPVRSRCLHPGQQHGRRWPSSNSSRVRRIRRCRVVSCLASSTQQMNSLRANDVMSPQAFNAVVLPTNAVRRSAGNSCTTPPGTC